MTPKSLALRAFISGAEMALEGPTPALTVLGREFAQGSSRLQARAPSDKP